MKKLLFLGDSITDCHRNFINPPLGCGYVSLLSKELYHSGFETELYNLGADGFTLSRLLENCTRQYLPLEPDIVIILIGINDIALMMNTLRTPSQQEEMLQNFFLRYRELLEKFPTSKLLLMEPFIFPWPSEFKHWIPFVKRMSEGIAAIAQDLSLPYILLHDALNEEGKHYGMDFITTDGVHLTSRGHEIIAEKLLHTLKTYV